MKASLKEDNRFKMANKEKDVISIKMIPKKATFHYRSSEEPVKPLWKAQKDFFNLLCQH